MAYINLLNICRTGTKALGPGLRYVLWVQGCPFSCPSCLTPEGREIHAKLMTQTEIIAQDIINNPVIDGITISGVEPFLQASSFQDIVNRVRIVRPDFNVIVCKTVNICFCIVVFKKDGTRSSFELAAKFVVFSFRNTNKFCHSVVFLFLGDSEWNFERLGALAFGIGEHVEL